MPPHTDLSQLERLYKGDRTRMARWVGIYLEETPWQLQRLAACLERADLEGLLAIVHDLKPTKPLNLRRFCVRLSDLLLQSDSFRERLQASSFRAASKGCPLSLAPVLDWYCWSYVALFFHRV